MKLTVNGLFDHIDNIYLTAIAYRVGDEENYLSSGLEWAKKLYNSTINNTSSEKDCSEDDIRVFESFKKFLSTYGNSIVIDWEVNELCNRLWIEIKKGE